MSASDVFAPILRDVAISLLGKPDKVLSDGKVLRWGSRGSFKVDVPAGVWHDKEANEGGGTLDLVKREKACDKASALQWLENEGHIEPRETREKVFYDYRDEAGSIIFRVERCVAGAHQRFLQHGPDGHGGFVCRAGCMKGVRKVLYHLDRLAASPADAVVFFTEGEKDCDRLIAAGLVATTNPGGAGKYEGLAECVAKHLTGRRVVILEDNDQAGANHVTAGVTAIAPHAASVTGLKIDGLPPKGDVSDWLNAGGTPARLMDLAEAALSAPKQKRGLAFQKGVSARALMAKQFAPIRWIIPGVLSEGMYVLAGAPKLGKSWLALGWMLAVGSGGNAMGSIPCEQGDVLGLMLEDNERRLQRRIRQMRLAGIPDNVTLLTEWPTIDDGCLAEIEAWIAGVEKPRLIVVDVFARVKGSKGGKETDYDFDYRQAALLQSIASRHGLAVVVVHHTRKMAADDPFDEVSGTRGLTGAADGVLVLKRESGGQQIVLYGRGRDLEEVEKALQFDKDTGTWSILGEAWLVADTAERRAIQQILGRSVDPMTPTELAERTGKSRPNIAKMLTKMAEDGQVERIGRGQYVLVTTVTKNTPSGTIVTNVTTSYTPEDEPDYLGGWGTRSESGE